MNITCPKCGFVFPGPTVSEGSEPKPRVTETRDSVGDMEIRHFPVTEVRVVRGTDGKPDRLTGYVAVFNDLSKELRTKSGKSFFEKIAPGAFKRSLESGEDIPLLYAHDPKKILARTSAKTLTLREDDKGLAFDATLPKTSLAADLIADVEHGNVRGMSFGFDEPKDSWEKTSDGKAIRTLNEIDLGEASATPFPAYEGTSIESRSVDRGLEELDKREHPGDYSVVAEHARMMTRACRDMCGNMMSVRDTMDATSGDLSDRDRKHVRDMHEALKELHKRNGELRERSKAMLADDDNDAQDEPDDDADDRSSIRILSAATEMGLTATEARALLPKHETAAEESAQ